VTSILEKAISRANRQTSVAADFISIFTWVGIVLCVILAPFTLGVSLLYLLLVPVEFAFARMVSEQVKQTELMKVMIRVQAGELVDEPEEATEAREASTSTKTDNVRMPLSWKETNKAIDAIEDD
jgi:hypothetical protein